MRYPGVHGWGGRRRGIVCPVEFSGECGNTWVSWTYGTFRVAVCMVLWNSLELGVYGIFGSLDLRILSVPPESKNGGLCVFASRLVLRIFLESYGTLGAVSAPLVMPPRLGHSNECSIEYLAE
jgi:hypothetical protein